MISMESLLTAYPPQVHVFRRNILAEYLQCRVLASIYESGYGSRMCFMGGTAIRLCHGSLRFSEDLDFDNRGLDNGEFRRLSQDASRRLALEGYANEADFSFKGAFRCFLRFKGIYFRYGLSGHEDEKLILQLDAEPQGLKYAVETKVINRFGVFARVIVPSPAVLLSMKISALLGRRREKGRDFYDVTFLSGITAPDYGYLKVKCGINDGKELKQALYEKVSKLKMKDVAADVSPFLFTKSDEQRVAHFEDFIGSMKV
ncbi:MAG: nucleotidyl transferase AbiEii/AbiGii toxin family protein [Spirochaetia bacterium]|nr:nucleotidyl transferase AbiEii/AbiGii toxin family protein [Spirochaetia bacterium]